MLLKRSIVLAAGVFLFIVGFLIYFHVSHAQMEDLFRAEREKFHVQDIVLTSSEPATSPASSSAATAPAPALDTNTLIGPVPPPSSSAPDSTAAPASSSAPASSDTNSAPAPTPAPTTTPDPNSAPMPPSSSTMDYPKEASRSPFMPASYRPGDGAEIQMATTLTGAIDSPSTTPTPPVASPVTNAVPPPAPTPTATPAPTPSTPPVATSPVANPYSFRTPTNATPTATAPSPSTQAAPAPSSTVASGLTRPVAGQTSVIVLLYHQFRPAGVPIPAMYRWTMNQDVFESEMKYIHDNGYHVIPMADLTKFLRHEITLPPGCVVITIDDGYKSAIEYAAPILKKYGYPWTFFIYPAFITTGEGPGAASWNDLLALQAQGIDIESHSMTHPKLTRKGNKTPEQYDSWLTNETAGAKALLEQKMSKPITCFAYPYGDYNKEVEAKAIAAGYQAIFTVADNPVHSTTDPHNIGRYTITREEEKNFPAYLRQSALSLNKAEPEPGATITNPLPVITAVLAPMGADKIDPASIETSVRDFGEVRHDFDPQTNTLRLYLSRPLVSQVVLVNLRAKDAATGQIMVANWHFNYEPGATATTTIHPPIVSVTNSPAASPAAPTQAPAPAPKPTTPSTTTNAPEVTDPPSSQKNAAGAPLDPPQAPPASPH